MKIDLNAARNTTRAQRIQYMYADKPTLESGTFSMTTLSLRGAFEGIGNARSGYQSASFTRFCNLLDAYRSRIEERYQGLHYPAGSPMAGLLFNPANGTVNRYSADVMVPAFLSAYTHMGNAHLNLFPTLAHLLPNWTLRYAGLARLPWFNERFKRFDINHAYRSIYSVGSYSSFSNYWAAEHDMGFMADVATGNLIPSSRFNVAMVSLNEAFSPLIGIDMMFESGLTAKLEYRTVRSINLSLTSIQLNEAQSKDWVVGVGYRINDFNLLGMGKRRPAKSRRNARAKAASSAPSNEPSRKVNRDLTLSLDMSYRRQASLLRDIATQITNASSGTTALRFNFMASYTLSRMLTMTFFYDFQNNTPLLSGSSYPMSTHDFGLSIKFSLTR